MDSSQFVLIVLFVSILFMVGFMYLRFGPPQYKREEEEERRKKKA